MQSSEAQLPRIDPYTCSIENPVLEEQYREHRWQQNRKVIDGVFIVFAVVMSLDLAEQLRLHGPIWPIIVVHPLIVLGVLGFRFSPAPFRKRWYQHALVFLWAVQHIYQMTWMQDLQKQSAEAVEFATLEILIVPTLLIFILLLMPFRFILAMACSVFLLVTMSPMIVRIAGEQPMWIVMGIGLPFAVLAWNKWRYERGSRLDYVKTVSIEQTRSLMQQTLQRYFGEVLSDTLLTQDGDLRGETRWVTLSFTDLASYSTILERMSPSVAIKFLNEYFTAMHDVIDAHGGQILNYIGDAIMVIYGAPKDLEDPELKAVQCAIEMRERLELLNEKWDESQLSRYWRHHGIEKITARTGLHTGNAITGNLGSTRMLQYSAIGDVVNVAARLEQANKQFGSTIAFSQEIYTALTEDLYEKAEFQGEVQLKGRESETKVYSI